jgi:hypothetical protein
MEQIRGVKLRVRDVIAVAMTWRVDDFRLNRDSRSGVVLSNLQFPLSPGGGEGARG